MGVISNYTFRGIEGEIAKAIYNAISILRQLGAEIVTLDSRFLEEFDQVTYSTIALYEFSQVLQVEYAVNPNIFAAKVQSDLSKGVKISHHNYKKAKQKWERWLPVSQKLFEQVDVVLTPTTPMVAPPINSDRKIYQLNQRFMLPFSLMGLPAISLPCGWSSQGLPIGLQIVSNSYDEALILRVALAFQIATAFSKGSPL